MSSRDDPKQTGIEPDRRNVAPSVAFPKGGGALRPIDEKFAVNAANGTAELTLPLTFSKTRSGLDSSLALHYNSGSGNGPFGLGWSLDLPTIQRRTDKKLPRYEDANEGDVFLFSGAEDLIPAYFQNLGGDWVPDTRTLGAITVERYRPRVEGAFARIEKITVAAEPGFYWKVTSRDNGVTVFGRTPAARLTDPGDPGRIFRWLPEWQYDDKGNCVEFIYKDEDLANIQSVVEEKHRLSGAAPFVNKYLKRVLYGNTSTYYPDPQFPFDPARPVNPGYLFDAVFDYGEHDGLAPSPIEVLKWPCRFDPFSDYRAGFEIRCYRLCRRILFFHSFAELDFAPAPYLVRSLDLTYNYFHFDNAPYVSQEADFPVREEKYRDATPDEIEQDRKRAEERVQELEAELSRMPVENAAAASPPVTPVAPLATGKVLEKSEIDAILKALDTQTVTRTTLGPRAIRAFIFRYQLARLLLNTLKVDWTPETLANSLAAKSFGVSAAPAVQPISADLSDAEKLQRVVDQVC